MRRAELFFLGVAFALGARWAAAEPVTLADYQPVGKIPGVLRSWGSPRLGELLQRWQQGFRRYHPEVFFSDNLKGTAMAIAGLGENTADLALMGRQIYTFEFYSIYRRSLLLPVEIEVATGSVDEPGKSPALTVFVHRDNPLAQLTLAQLDGIYGAQREGGWQGMKWERAAARGPAKNLRTWGQLGLTGEWADKPIHPYGPPGLAPGGVSFFQSRVMAGADTWAEGVQEFADRKLMLEALGKDPLGIAYSGLGDQTRKTKPLALATGAAGPFVLPTRESVALRTYPLARPVYIYFAPDTPGGEVAAPVDPKIQEFLRYVLSRQGQQDVAGGGGYLPLPPDVAREQLRKLNSPTPNSP